MTTTPKKSPSANCAKSSVRDLRQSPHQLGLYHASRHERLCPGAGLRPAYQMTEAQVPAPASANIALTKIAASIGDRVHGVHIVDNSGTKPRWAKYLLILNEL
jgi:hypothetical protein